jgi:hypothetical protein
MPRGQADSAGWGGRTGIALYARLRSRFVPLRVGCTVPGAWLPPSLSCSEAVAPPFEVRWVPVRGQSFYVVGAFAEAATRLEWSG